MKEYLIELIRSEKDASHARNLAREYLQALILSSLQRSGAMLCLAFHGGTSLRFLFGSRRFSEDLDFALELDRKHYDFQAYLNAIHKDLPMQGYSIALKVNDKKTVHSAFIRFQGLWYELGLSSQPGETLSIKLEVDTNPPAGAALQISLVRRHVLLRLQHHDKASLLAGKIHAILQRPFLKGRDLYDLLWYLSDPDWPAPNLILLNNALQQTGWNKPIITDETWRIVVMQRLQDVNWKNIKMDLRPFVQPGDDIIEAINLENFKRLLSESTPFKND